MSGAMNVTLLYDGMVQKPSELVCKRDLENFREIS